MGGGGDQAGRDEYRARVRVSVGERGCNHERKESGARCAVGGWHWGS